MTAAHGGMPLAARGLVRHLVNGDGMPGNTEAEAEAEAWAATIDGPVNAVDDQTAFTVSDGRTEIVSRGALAATERVNR